MYDPGTPTGPPRERGGGWADHGSAPPELPSCFRGPAIKQSGVYSCNYMFSSLAFANMLSEYTPHCSKVRLSNKEADRQLPVPLNQSSLMKGGKKKDN